MAFSQEQIINLRPEPLSPVLHRNVATHLPSNYIFNNCVSTNVLSPLPPQQEKVNAMASDQMILDGAFGATIRWKSLAPVATIKRNTTARTVAKLCIRLTPAYF